MTKDGQIHINKSRTIIQTTAQYISAYSLARSKQLLQLRPGRVSSQ